VVGVVVAFAYLGVGVVAVFALARAGDRRQPILLALLWPYLLPVRLLATDAPQGVGADPAERAVRAAKEALARLPRPPEEAAAALDTFLVALRRSSLRVSELEVARRQAPPSVQARLSELLAAEEARLHEGLGTLDELTAQLTLLRFVAPGPDAAAEEDPVRDLLVRIQALVEL